ncbi:TPA: EI24 domain-containing protein [Pseudomonas aeruginosa]|uniref:EI24 domain-containing protein n=1 Tax=Pseudomonas aeruginosa TaxID=287 RepID=UPI0007A8B276|nr:EI24 domain-containing protein [Pseudomonas aeruginosa]EKU1956629.1 EI24 domain-containing protein [Pseudomonas aeruginosa]EKV3604167.1 EI24 domain-containing protein [Pseudomonas aeruginosa]EKW6792203.1 EI24 domain-containing protein [Pseudomonas aeruginosa]EMB2846102.1 EI24 domain-containing protein [Pseudomonas aeruginosa]KYO76292.1 hypothetical protein LT18_05228 [Pseudomonas aeruginosa]
MHLAVRAFLRTDHPPLRLGRAVHCIQRGQLRPDPQRLADRGRQRWPVLRSAGGLQRPGGTGATGFYFVGYAALFFVVLYAASIVFGIRLGLRIGLLGQLKEQVRQRYPRLAPASGERISLWRAAGFRLAPWLGVSGSILVGLLVPLYNGVLLLLALAYLNIRFLLPATLAGLADAGEQLAVLRARRGSLLLFGLLILLLALVPLLNLLLPAVLGGGTCHLANRGLAQLRGEATAESGSAG